MSRVESSCDAKVSREFFFRERNFMPGITPSRANANAIRRIKQSIHERHRDEEKSGIVAGDHLSSSCTRVLPRWSVYYLKSLKRLKEVIEESDECNSKSAKTGLRCKIDESESQLWRSFSCVKAVKMTITFQKRLQIKELI